MITPEPLFPDVGVLALPPEAWGGPWQRRHHVLTRLARYFHVVWVDPPREWREVWLQKRDSPREKRETERFGRGFSTYTPDGWLPLVYRPASLANWLAHQRLRRAELILRRRGCRKIVLALWQPDQEGALDTVKHDLSWYFIDDEYSFSPVELPLDEREARLIRRVQQVCVHSASIFAKKGILNPRTVLIPNGVDYRAYAHAEPEPEDLKDLPRPRIGYVGKIKAQLDWRLMTHLTSRHPDWNFVFVGPRGFLGDQASLIEDLARRPNVHFLGARDIGALPAYTQHLDVCLLCYEVNDYTKYIYPLKLHEYLAAGRPVVGPPLPALQEFADVVALARTPEEWSSVLDLLVKAEAHTPDLQERRRQVASQFDWARLVRQLAEEFCCGLGIGHVARFDRMAPVAPLEQESLR